MAIEIRTNAPKSVSRERMQEKIASAPEEPDVFAGSIDDAVLDWTGMIVQKHQERLAYNAAYQRDLRTIKRLGLSVTVAQYRKSKET